MQLPARVDQIVRALWAQHQDLAHGTDDQRRELTLLMAEQCRFELGPTWGTKSADSGRPPSKDSIANQDGGTLWGWDTINGSTREPQTFPGMDGENITGQHFIDVHPVDHLGGTSEPGHPEPPAPGDDAFENDVRASLGRVEANQAEILANQVRMDQKLNAILVKPAPAVDFPVLDITLKGSVIGGASGTATPREA